MSPSSFEKSIRFDPGPGRFAPTAPIRRRSPGPHGPLRSGAPRDARPIKKASPIIGEAFKRFCCDVVLSRAELDRPADAVRMMVPVVVLRAEH
jgi:hypothetical protein